MVGRNGAFGILMGAAVGTLFLVPAHGSAQDSLSVPCADDKPPFASLLLSSGVNLKVTSEMLGHSNISITADTYSHVLPGLQEEAVLALSRRLAQGS